ncbi:MAG: MOSC domain-containing protein [Firmicutes bacterium]|nr:MOSC domain-containing protein [Bacillota bacterium]
MGKVTDICISEKRGTLKDSVDSCEIVFGYGVKGDGHGGDWDMQVSVFPEEALDKVPEDMYEEVMAGGKTENITIKGIELEKMMPGNIIVIGDVELEIKKVGKDKYKTHDRHYIVSREGRFCRVLKSGSVKVGDEVLVR